MNRLRENPFLTEIDNEPYILGRFIKQDNNTTTHYAVLICLNNGNRYDEPIEISERVWMGLNVKNNNFCKYVINNILNEANKTE